MTHIYDIVHVFPTIFIYEPVMSRLGSIVSSEFIFVPIVMIIDFNIGEIIGFKLSEFTKCEKSYITDLIFIFLIYLLGITF